MKYYVLLTMDTLLEIKQYFCQIKKLDNIQYQ